MEISRDGQEVYSIVKNVYGDFSDIYWSNSLVSILEEWDKHDYEYPYYFVSVYRYISAKGKIRRVCMMDISVKVEQSYDIDEAICEVNPPTYGNKAW